MKKTILALGLAAGLTGCGAPRGGDYTVAFQKAAIAAPGAELTVAEGDEALARFRDYFQNVTRESIRQKTADLYAEEVWFNDTLKTLRGRNAVEAYFLKTMDHVDLFKTVVDGVAR